MTLHYMQVRVKSFKFYSKYYPWRLFQTSLLSQTRGLGEKKEKMQTNK